MLEECLSEEKKIIDEELKNYFKITLKSETIQNTLLVDFIKKVKEFLLPPSKSPKRLHPIILISAFSGIANPHYVHEMMDDVRSISLAVEFLHNAKIMHDDLIDGDVTRRDAPSYHIMWGNYLKETYTNKDFPDKEVAATEFGSTMAILGGSFTNFIGTQILLNSRFDNELKSKALAEYNEAANFITKGLIIEEFMFWNKITMSLEQYLNIAELKTARLLEKSAKIGAILAKGNTLYQINHLSDAMMRTGQAYSIKDDILDLEKDIMKGEKKFPYIICVQNTDEAQQKTLNELYGRKDLSKSEVQEIINIIEQTQAMLIAEQFAMNLISQAKTSLKKIYPALNKKSEEFFNEFMDFGFKRKY